uniref:Putative terminase n=1 Tax=viral metagenome TaxID=1070528 RepID=A0A6H1ZW41_9ZZZZ
MTNVDLFPEYCKLFMSIVPTRGASQIPFELNPIQSFIFREYMVPRYKSGLPIRLNILKMRQSGVSTLFEGWNWWCGTGHTDWNALVVASDEDQGELVLEMMHNFHDNWPEGTYGLPKFFIKQKSGGNFWFKKPDERVKKFSTDELKSFWWLDLNSKIRVRSAEKKTALGRAGTWQSVHASEVAYWPMLTGALTSLLACCHEEPETSVVLETTANGMNEYYDFWENRHVSKIDVPFNWQNIFIPWYWDSRYESHSFTNQRGFINEEEEILFNRILEDSTFWEEIDPGLTEERIWNKLWWRRYVIQEKAQGDIEFFNQEWPSTPTEAFRSTGLNVFKPAAIARIEKEIKAPEWQGNLSAEPVDKAVNRWSRSGVSLEKSMHQFEYGRLKVYEKPVQHEAYIVAADVAEGKAIEGANEDNSRHDFSVAQILKVSSYPPVEQVAVWHGSIDTHMFGYLLVALAQWYNSALLAWEANSIGSALKTPIVDHCKYRNYFMREDWDKLGRRKAKYPGWYTSSKNKRHMVTLGQMFVHGGEVVIVDRATLSEMKSYAVLRENKWGAARGHDDRVMALMVALTIIEPRIALMKRMSDKKKEADQVAEEGMSSVSTRMLWKEQGGGMNKYFGDDF